MRQPRKPAAFWERLEAGAREYRAVRGAVEGRRKMRPEKSRRGKVPGAPGEVGAGVGGDTHAAGEGTPFPDGADLGSASGYVSGPYRLSEITAEAMSKIFLKKKKSKKKYKKKKLILIFQGREWGGKKK